MCWFVYMCSVCQTGAGAHWLFIWSHVWAHDHWSMCKAVDGFLSYNDFLQHTHSSKQSLCASIVASCLTNVPQTRASRCFLFHCQQTKIGHDIQPLLACFHQGHTLCHSVQNSKKETVLEVDTCPQTRQAQGSDHWPSNTIIRHH